MVTLKTKQEIAILREGGRRLAEVLLKLAEAVRPGVSSATLDKLAYDLIAKAGDQPAFLGYKGRYDKEPYPASICVSVNDEIVHGEPLLAPKIFKEGDIVSLDAGLVHKGFFTDAAITVPVGKIDEKAARLIKVTRIALEKGIAAVRAGATTGDIGFAIEQYIKSAADFSVVRQLAGHGVGYAVHEDPFVPNYGRRGEGIRLEPGMVIAIEPMISEGGSEIYLAPNGHTYKTKDGSRSAHFEHTIVVTENGAEVLTKV
jgi:methionyl aminopeptidase